MNYVQCDKKKDYYKNIERTLILKEKKKWYRICIWLMYIMYIIRILERK
jgi:hypothetical protein